MVATTRSPLGRRRSRIDRSFVEVVGVLFLLGLGLEVAYLSVPRSGGISWLWFVPGLLALFGILWLVAREPANL